MHLVEVLCTSLCQRICTVQWRHSRCPWSAFQGQTIREKYPLMKFMFATVAANNGVPNISAPEKLLQRDVGLGGGLRSLSTLYSIL